jgi:UDP-GlcNAc:undecaprenyl-phosphate GlcNAc-1-phosphate transferase
LLAVTDSLSMEILLSVAAFGCPLIVSSVLTAALLRYAPRLGLVDLPSTRKFHSQPTPRGGGLAIYGALVVTVALFSADVSLGLTTLLTFGAAIVVLGFLDDARPLPWQLRLGIQTLVAAIIVYGWPTEVSLVARAVALFWIVGLINAFNMLDNMDALSGGVAWIVTGLMALGTGLRLPETGGLAAVWPYLMLMGALSGFLWFNRPPARIFMGDAGSTFLGFFLGVRSIEGRFIEPAVPQTWAVPLCLMAVPWYDLFFVVLLRLWQGRSPFHADKQHLSHRLVYRGLSSVAAVRVIHLLCLATGLAGLLLYQLSRGGAILLGAELGCWWLAIAVIEYLPHLRSGKQT